jgi:hypothetical protein
MVLSFTIPANVNHFYELIKTERLTQYKINVN